MTLSIAPLCRDTQSLTSLFCSSNIPLRAASQIWIHRLTFPEAQILVRSFFGKVPAKQKGLSQDHFQLLFLPRSDRRTNARMRSPTNTPPLLHSHLQNLAPSERIMRLSKSDGDAQERGSGKMDESVGTECDIY